MKVHICVSLLILLSTFVDCTTTTNAPTPTPAPTKYPTKTPTRVPTTRVPTHAPTTDVPTSAPTFGKCCVSDNATCDECQSYSTSHLCDSLSLCEDSCGGVFCDSYVLPNVSTTCDTGVDFGRVTYGGTVRVPNALLRAPFNITGRRLLGVLDFLERHTIGVLRTIPVLGAVVALATPGYDDGGADGLTAELEASNRLISTLGNSLADLATKAAIEADLRIQADAVLVQMVDAAVADVNSLRTKVLGGNTALLSSIQLLQIGVTTSNQASVFLSELDNNIALMRLSVTSASVQKFLKVASLSVIDPELDIDFTPDVFRFYVTSHMYAWGGYSFWAQFSEITVTRRPTALSYVGAPGDTYIYEASVRPVSILEDVQIVTAACTGMATNSSLVEVCAASWMSRCHSDPNLCWFGDLEGSGGYVVEDISYGPNHGTQQGAWTACAGFGVCCGPFGIVCPGECLLNSRRTCDELVDTTGARPTTLWLPLMICDDPFITCYPTDPEHPKYDSRAVGWDSVPCYIGNGDTCYEPRENLTSLIPMSTDFFDPIYIAKKFFPVRNHTMSAKFREMFDAGGRDNVNLVYGVYDNFTTLPIGYLDGVTTPVVLDPSLFASSFNIISYSQGLAPLAGWTGTTGCRVTDDDHMCCEDFAIGTMLPFILQQLGYDAENAITTYQPRVLYDQIQDIYALLAITGSLNASYSVNATLVQKLSAINDATIVLTKDLGAIKKTATAVAVAADAAVVRLNALEAANSASSTTTYVIIAIVSLVVVGGVWYYMRRRRSGSLDVAVRQDV